jgi:hypothetical protein
MSATAGFPSEHDVAVMARRSEDAANVPGSCGAPPLKISPKVERTLTLRLSAVRKARSKSEGQGKVECDTALTIAHVVSTPQALTLVKQPRGIYHGVLILHSICSSPDFGLDPDIEPLIDLRQPASQHIVDFFRSLSTDKHQARRDLHFAIRAALQQPDVDAPRCSSEVEALVTLAGRGRTVANLLFGLDGTCGNDLARFLITGEQLHLDRAIERSSSSYLVSHPEELPMPPDELVRLFQIERSTDRDGC